MKIAFLDRDGIINRERGDYTWKKDHFEFTENLIDFLYELKELSFQIVVITNQGGIDKGLYTAQQVDELHKWMRSELSKKDIDILDVFYCPHHDSIQRCICRKPNSQMLEKAIALYDPDLKASFMVGDSERDVNAGEKAGLRSFQIKANPDWLHVDTKAFYHG